MRCRRPGAAPAGLWAKAPPPPWLKAPPPPWLKAPPPPWAEGPSTAVAEGSCTVANSGGAVEGNAARGAAPSVEARGRGLGGRPRSGALEPGTGLECLPGGLAVSVGLLRIDRPRWETGVAPEGPRAGSHHERREACSRGRDVVQDAHDPILPCCHATERSWPANVGNLRTRTAAEAHIGLQFGRTSRVAVHRGTTARASGTNSACQVVLLPITSGYASVGGRPPSGNTRQGGYLAAPWAVQIGFGNGGYSIDRRGLFRHPCGSRSGGFRGSRFVTCQIGAPMTARRSLRAEFLPPVAQRSGAGTLGQPSSAETIRSMVARFVGRLRGRHLLVADVLGIVAAAYVALALAYDNVIGTDRFLPFLPIVFVLVAVRVVSNIRLGLYNRHWQFASVPDLERIVAAVLVGSIGAFLIVAAAWIVVPFHWADGFPRSFWLVEALIAGAFIGGVRFSIRAASDWAPPWRPAAVTDRRKTLIYGAGRTGVLMAGSARRNPGAGVVPVGFLDDDPTPCRRLCGKSAGIRRPRGARSGDRHDRSRGPPHHHAERDGQDDQGGRRRGDGSGP